MKERIKKLFDYMPDNIVSILSKTLLLIGNSLEEIRFRTKKPLVVITNNGAFGVLSSGKLTSVMVNSYIVSETDMKKLFQLICENSVYAYLEEIKNGFITLRGGNRVGITGKAIMEKNLIKNVTDISSLNFRVSREIIGVADPIIGHILSDGYIKNTLIISPPGGGKTTVIRDVARQISNVGFKVGIIDERSEIAAMAKGVAYNDVGLNTDVIDSVPRHIGVVSLIRSMSPHVIITDEISNPDDVKAILTVTGSGTSIIATAHSQNLDEIKNKEMFSKILGANGFSQIIAIKRNGNKINFEIKSTTS